jgi:phospholipase/carboxylesterase
VLLLHGFGSNGADMISLAPHWQDALPDALFLAPHAPQRCGMMSIGYQWWGLSAFDAHALAAGAASAAPAIDAFIDRKLAQYKLSEQNLALVGFSQGTMMALHVGLRRERQVAAIVGYSGMLTGAAKLASSDYTRPPVLLVHGSADSVVPVAALHAAERELRRMGVEVKAHVSSGMGHSVDPVGLRLGRDFAADALFQNA